MPGNGQRLCCLSVGVNFVAGSSEITTVDTSYQFLACQYIKVQIRELSRQLRGARLARDTEYVHQARVASRRLRAALGMFSGCFPDARMKRWQKQIKQLTGRLGAARDADVQIEFLKDFISKIPPARPATASHLNPKAASTGPRPGAEVDRPIHSRLSIAGHESGTPGVGLQVSRAWLLRML